MYTYIKKITLLLLIIITLSVVGGCAISNTETSTIADTTEGVYPRIEVIDITKTEYSLNSSFDHDSIVVALVKASGPAINLSSSVYTLDGFDSSVLGQETITITYLELTTTFDITIVDPVGDLVIDMTYYTSAAGLSGTELFDELSDIVNTGFSGVDYDTAKAALAVSDRDPANSSNIILVYLGTSVSGTWDAGDTWDREHVWPQSLLGCSASPGTVNTCSDLQNLKPATPSENSSRSNRYYDNESVTGLSYEPRDEVKGDVARILFYMITMYDELSLVDHNPSVYQMALFSVLLEWHESDPVDAFERNRNDVLYTYQHNRNPYIDYPEFVDMIWGE